ncbi:MAG: hypothetical protein JWP37_151 [Mucilaginibacter sp.]|nr:hypothetical protein [Mucilaginibacter sp.]
MKQQEVFKKIGNIIKELNEQYEYLDGNGGQLNDLEIELFVANARFLADHSEVLQKLNLQYSPAPVIEPKPGVKQEEKYFEPVVQQVKPSAEIVAPEAAPFPPDTSEKPVKAEAANTPADDNPTPDIDLSANGADDDFTYIRQEPDIIRHELNLHDIPNWEDEEDESFVNEELIHHEEEIIDTPAIPTVKEEPVKQVTEKSATEVKVESIKEEPLTVNQKMSAQLNNTGSRVTEQHTQTIDDLKSAITLNDKLLYIKDLFNGYNLAYSEAIDILNRLETFEEADKYLQNSYAVKNNWGSKQTTVDKFYSLLKRRYL